MSSAVHGMTGLAQGVAQGVAQMPKLKGVEIQPGITLLEEPVPVEGTNKLRALANVCGCLAVVELSIKFVLSQGEGDAGV